MDIEEEDDQANKPAETMARRITIKTEQSEADMEFDQSSDDLDEAEVAPWVDNVRLRHGMDWLDLITNEVERYDKRMTEGLRKTDITERRQ